MAVAEEVLARGRVRSLTNVSGIWHVVRRWPVIPLTILVALVLVGIFAPLIATHDPSDGRVRDRHIPPAWFKDGTGEHLLGTDHTGRDVFSRLVYGARISLMVASITVTTGFLVGTAIGLVSGYAGGLVDEVVIRLVDIWQALPFLLLALVAVIIFGQSLPLLLVLLALLSWVGFVRIVRAQTLVLRESDYVALAKVAGASPFRIILRHLLPGVLNSALVILTLNVGQLILAEATLSFLGAGIPPPTPAWGVMVAEGRKYLESSWWPTVLPGICIFLVVMSLNFLGDWLRDRLDPRLRQID